MTSTKFSIYKNVIDLAHLTPELISEQFPNAFSKFSCFTVVAVVRDPIVRLISACLEYFCVFLKRQASTLTVNDLEFYFDSVAESVSYDARFIHGRKQIDFLVHDKKIVPDVIIKVENMLPGIERVLILNQFLGFKLKELIDVKKNVRSTGSFLHLWHRAPPSLKYKVIDFYKDDFIFCDYPMSGLINA